MRQQLRPCNVVVFLDRIQGVRGELIARFKVLALGGEAILDQRELMIQAINRNDLI